MIRLIDYRCPRCKAEYKDVAVEVPSHAMDLTLSYYCGECQKNAGLRVACERLPSAPGFVVRGFNEKNGYGSRG